MKISIPRTIGEIELRLNGLDRLITAQGWERAAIVFAATYEPGRGGDRRNDQTSEVKSDHRKTVPDFAALGINGLRSLETIYDYRRHWQYAIDQKWVTPVTPGDSFDFPGLDDRHYPPTARPVKVETPEEKVARIRRELESDPQVRQTIDTDFVQRAAVDHELSAQVQAARWQHLSQNPLPLLEFGGTSRLDLFGVGRTLAAEIEHQSERVASLVRYLKDHRPLMPDDERLAHDALRSIERGRQHLATYEDQIYDALGVDRNDVARRLIASLETGGRP